MVHAGSLLMEIIFSTVVILRQVNHMTLGVAERNQLWNKPEIMFFLVPTMITGKNAMFIYFMCFQDWPFKNSLKKAVIPWKKSQLSTSKMMCLCMYVSVCVYVCIHVKFR